MMVAHWSAYFQMISAAIAYRTWSMITTMSCNYSMCHIFSDCFKYSKTVNISVAGEFIVGKYQTISREMLIDALIVMLNPVVT